MIEQLVSLTASQAGVGGIQSTNDPLSANPHDVTKFNMAVHDKKAEHSALLDIAPKANDGFLQIKKPQETSPLIKMDQEYKVILDKLKEPPDFNKSWDVKKTENKQVFRSNTMATEKPSLEKSLDVLMDDLKHSHKTSADIMKGIRQWGLRTHIWSSNIHVLTAIVGKASAAFKSLFHSAG